MASLWNLMPQFSDDYFRDLPPRDRRYDTPVADQLVFSVFPNGVKAWVHVYPTEDFVRRRTMGLFPEMDYETALTALEESRRIAAVDALETRRRPSPRRRGPRYFVVGLVAALLASLGTYLLIDPAKDSPGPDPAVERSPPPTDSKPGGRASDASPVQPMVASGRESEVAVPVQPGAEPAAVAANEGLTEAQDNVVEAVTPAEPDQTVETASSAADQPLVETVAQTVADQTRSEPADEPPESPAGDAQNTATTADAAPGPPPGALPLPGEPPRASPAPDLTAGPGAQAKDEESSGRDSSTAADLRVSRSALAMEIRNREPVSLIADELSLETGQTATVFFFTELHGVPGETVFHRWELDGTTVAEVPFTIGSGARWRVYSSKDIGPDDAGHWRALVVDAGGHEIDALSFNARVESP
jgi:hypothetical protein